MNIAEPALRAVARTIVAAGGSSAAEASAVAEHLVEANLSGHDSHGVGMLPEYVNCLRAGTLHPNRELIVVADHGCLLVLDGGQGYGQVMGRAAMHRAIERAAVHGVCVVALRNCFHLARIGAYAEQCAAAGMVSMHHVNVIGHGPLVAPFGGSDRRFSTNPYTCAVPGTATTPPTVLDMATSQVAYGKVRVARARGESLPAGALVDAAGQPSRDPNVMFEPPLGALNCFGAHKGYALAVMNELLAGAIAGGGTIADDTRTDAIVNGMLSVVIEPGRLTDPHTRETQIDRCVAHIKASPPADPTRPVMVPGDPERAARATRAREGIDIEPDTWEAILEAGEALGIERAQLLSLAAGTL